MNWTMRTDPSGFETRWCDDLATRYRAEGHWRDSTLVDAARAALTSDPEHLLLIEGDRRLTRREAWEQSLRLAAFFLARGLKPGDVISFQLPNWVESAVIALAARMTGLVINPVPPIYRESELAYILADCRSKLIFVPGTFRKHDYSAMLRGLRGSLPELRDVVVVRGSGDLTWEQAMATLPLGEEDFPLVDPSAVMMAMYTSGTTGKPKGVLHTHYSYDHRARAMGEAWGIGTNDIVFMPSPVTHITGALWAFDMTWIHGSASVLMDVWTVEEGIRVIEDNRCTVNGGATPFLQQLLDTAGSRPEAIASLRLFFCGGTTVSPDLIRKASETFPGCLFFRCYGSTEMVTATLGIQDRSQADLGADTDGAIVYPAELRIIDAVDDHPLPVGEEGEIIARGPGLFFGYAHPSDNDGQFDDDGFFRMGDLGRIVRGSDGGEYIVITGRKKDIIIRSGENISPKEVEDLLFNHPAVAEVAIVAMPSPVTGEKGCAFIIPRDGQHIDLPEIKRFLDNEGNFDEAGFFRMGDLGRIVRGSDGGDYIVITGRKKDIIIRSGENISPKEVEDLLGNHPAVAEVAIVAMPSAATGEKGCAFIIPRGGQAIDLPEIRRFLDSEGLARQKFPEHVVLVDDLPRVPSGKVKKDVLRIEARRIAESSAA